MLIIVLYSHYLFKGGQSMSQELDNIWNDVLNIIKVELTEVSYNTWLKTIVPYNMTNNTIVLAAPNDFTKGILEGRYLNLIKNAIKEVTKKEYLIKFIRSEERRVGKECKYRWSKYNEENKRKK